MQARQIKKAPHLTFQVFRKDTTILTKREQMAVDFFVELLKTTKGSDTAITNGYLVDNWNRVAAKKISDISGRRIIRHIRITGLIRKLMADNYGYFIASNNKDYQRYLDMLTRRIKTLSRTHHAMKNQM